MELLRKKFTEGAGLVEAMLEAVEKALAGTRDGFIEEVRAYEDKINQLENELDFYCTSIISLYGPEARDLRTVLMILKMNNELERVGDLLWGIAKSLRLIREKGSVVNLGPVTKLLSEAGKMFHSSINAFLQEDHALAESILAQDDAVDEERSKMVRNYLMEMEKEPKQVESLYHLIKITQNAERIADHATNISEDVIYMVEGRNVKHHGND
ncbi:MAG: phosphate signaling complex protein PhoU [Spirochaetia bacterium]|nr:phosphate signaling complex protein PhoU [Spirochaetia bacterium]